jgi:hypothetical protein
MTAPLVSIIILHWRGLAATRRCLTSLQQLDYASYRVILVGNGALPGEIPTLCAEFPQVEALTNEENRGFASGVNPAIRHALNIGSAYVLLLNNDTLVPPDLLTHLVQIQQQHPHIGILSPRLKRDDPRGLLAGLGCRVTRYSVHPVAWNAPGTAYTKREVLFFDAVFGTAMFATRTVFEQIGLFDERFFFYYEDIDLCLRARAAGFAIACYTGVTVHHTVAASTRHVRGLRFFYLARSRELFFAKHLGPLRWRIFLLREGLHIARTARTQWRSGIPANALGYLVGALVGIGTTYAATTKKEGS